MSVCPLSGWCTGVPAVFSPAAAGQARLELGCVDWLTLLPGTALAWLEYSSRSITGWKGHWIYIYTQSKIFTWYIFKDLSFSHGSGVQENTGALRKQSLNGRERKVKVNVPPYTRCTKIFEVRPPRDEPYLGLNLEVVYRWSLHYLRFCPIEMRGFIKRLMTFQNNKLCMKGEELL